MTARRKASSRGSRKGSSLTVKKTTLKDLQSPGKGPKGGGWFTKPISWTCPQPVAGKF
jgi:hypothetical protein